MGFGIGHQGETVGGGMYADLAQHAFKVGVALRGEPLLLPLLEQRSQVAPLHAGGDGQTQ